MVAGLAKNPKANETARRGRLSTRKKLLFAAILTGFVLAVSYAGSLLYRTHQLYSFILLRHDSWDESIHQPDRLLGFSPIPDSVGTMLNQGFPIPVRYDHNGCRVPIDFDPPADYFDRRPLVMAIGCSFTFGDGCNAEESYPFLVADQLGGRAMNAGVCSYGLAQMVCRGESLLREHQPDFLLVQFSPWLIDRSKQFFGDSSHTFITQPFFCNGDDGVQLHPPLYLTQAFDLRTHVLGNGTTPASYWQFAKKAGVHYTLFEDWQWTKRKLGWLTGLSAQPSRNNEDIVRWSYQRLADAAREMNCQMLIVVVSRDASEVEIYPDALPAGVPVVEAHAEMVRRLDRPEHAAFKLRYGSWLGSASNQILDDHPNPAAHQIIAEMILSEINEKSE